MIPGMEVPCILICPFCGQVTVHTRDSVLIFPEDYISNKVCAECGPEVPLVFFGLHPGSWSLREPLVGIEPSLV